MSTGGLEITVNGERHDLGSGCTVAELLASLGLAGRRVAVARNRSVVPRSRYASTAIDAGDRIEILEAVGGG
ncbi:MAG: sulfur carrier protein ThiS [Myxococcota bacterium]|nr:sulfur carrier protein ThiS [Myxococcales bacterium]